MDEEMEEYSFDDADGYQGEDVCEDCDAEGVDVRDVGYKMVCRDCWDEACYNAPSSDYEERMEERRQMGLGNF